MLYYIPYNFRNKFPESVKLHQFSYKNEDGEIEIGEGPGIEINSLEELESFILKQKQVMIAAPTDKFPYSKIIISSNRGYQY